LNAVKEERAHRAAAVAAELERAYLEQWVGQCLPVLFEEQRDGLWRGHTTRYTQVSVASGEELHNQVRHVRLTRMAGGGLRGELLSPQA
jgi:threonylcarbamoyladenosine tRNA methylthiotransferase MtaB